MKISIYILILSIGLLAFVSFIKCEDTTEDENGTEDKDEDDAEKDVLVLTNDNFDEAVASHDTLLVEFYAPWCGHCKTLAPEYAKAATALKDVKHPVTLGKVDATVETDLASKYDVNGYPTLKFFKNGQVHDYEGPRNHKGITEFMQDISAPTWKPPPEAVVTLTKSNFSDFVQNTDLALVEFYAPWCGHCKRLAPEYERAARILKHDPTIPLAKVDATKESELASEYGVSGYPTLKIFRKGRPSEYKGPRDERGIISYMINQQGEASKLKKTVKEMKDFMDFEKVVIVGFFEKDDDPLLRIYMDAANEMRDDFSFAHTFSKDARNHFRVNPQSVVVLNPERYYTKFEPKWHILNKKDFSVADVTLFVKDHQVPLVGEYNSPMEKYYSRTRPLCLVFYTVDWSFDHRDATQLWRNKIAAIAKDYKDITFAIADEDDQKDQVNQFGLGDSGEEINIGCHGKDRLKYPMEPMEEFDSDEIREFLDKLMKGKLKPYMKSQPIPKRKEGPVKTVVGKNFDSVVMDTKKDVLIEFYAPWCGHCKKFEPEYISLAKKLKDEKNLVLAKIDGTANDSPSQFEVSGFPTIYFAAANKKDEPVRYEGNRDLDDLQKFMENNAAVSFGKNLKEEL